MATISLIGVSGKINSGKDLVGQLIQYHTSEAYEKYSVEDYLKIYSKLGTFGIGYLPDYEIKKFADKLKDIVCMLIGCTRAQLEDREFKETPLGKEWNYYFAKDLSVGLYSSQEYNKLEAVQKSWFQEKQLTPRLLLQLLGTDCGRKIIHPNIWVNALFADYKPSQEYLYQKDSAKKLILTYPNWIITDVRFPNEAEAIKSRGGIVVRVNRPKPRIITNDVITDIIHNTKNFGIVEHESETALDNYKEFDYVFTNDGSIMDLYEKVKTIL